MKRINKSSAGFTLVEMLVAMAITLLMMAALARSFGFVGARVKESRADVALSNQLRDLTTRLSDELRRCTVSLQPSHIGEEPLGYFLYYEGPITDATSSLFRAALDVEGNLDLNDARYGDFDDYLAFTAVAQGNNWFTGKVPRFVLDQKTAELAGAVYAPVNFPGNPWDPVVIRSKYAEVVYFASPEYQNATLRTLNPAYIDVDGDLDFDGDGNASENGIPDRINLHRRVLLIRPDLNLAGGGIESRIFNGVPLMRADDWPMGNTGTTTLDTTLPAAVLGNAWLYGMAGVHQQCDLSLRRVRNASGLPTGAVAANSLADLSKPHNRFAHVRVPNNVLIGGGAVSPTSMPVLALGTPPLILNALNGSGDRIAPPATPSVGPVVTPSGLSGFLRPEFVLGTDALHLESPLDVWGRERRGEDVLANRVLAFDLQVYDPEVSFFTTDHNLVVGPNDPGYREALRAALAVSSGAAAGQSVDQFITRTKGGFVDLAYPVLAGGALRGWQARPLDRMSTANDLAIGAPGNARDRFFLVTPFSGIAGYVSGETSQTAYQAALYGSGRLVTEGTSIRLFQPAFDTFTNYYETDGFLQGNPSGSGTKWSTNITSPGIDAGADGLDNDGLHGVDDLGERETLPPFLNRPEAIRISIRVENPSTRQIRQASVVHRDR